MMSSVQCPNSPTYHTSVEQKLRSKNAARQYKFGSPKLRDMLREKCRVRVRQARSASFDGSRKVSKIGENSLVSKILRQELADLESDLNLQEIIYKELIEEMDMWYVEQLEQEEEYLIEVGGPNVVFCPVCQKAAIEESFSHQMTCQCGVSFDYSGGLENLHKAIQSAIGQHEMQCSGLPCFFVEQNSNGKQKTLNAMCEDCNYFISLT